MKSEQYSLDERVRPTPDVYFTDKSAAAARAEKDEDNVNQATQSVSDQLAALGPKLDAAALRHQAAERPSRPTEVSGLSEKRVTDAPIVVEAAPPVVSEVEEESPEKGLPTELASYKDKELVFRQGIKSSMSWLKHVKAPLPKSEELAPLEELEALVISHGKDFFGGKTPAELLAEVRDLIAERNALLEKKAFETDLSPLNDPDLVDAIDLAIQRQDLNGEWKLTALKNQKWKQGITHLDIEEIQRKIGGEVVAFMGGIVDKVQAVHIIRNGTSYLLCAYREDKIGYLMNLSKAPDQDIFRHIPIIKRLKST